MLGFHPDPKLRTGARIEVALRTVPDRLGFRPTCMGSSVDLVLPGGIEPLLPTVKG